MRKLQLKPLATQRLQQGRKLLQPLDFKDELSFQEGEIVELYNPKNQFLAKAYLATQNKGIGWVYSFNKEENLDQAFFSAKFAHARQKRSALFADDSTTAFRIFNGEGDGLGGVTLDWYDGFILLQRYSVGIYQYRQMIMQAIKQVYPECKGVIGKNRFESNNLPDSEVLAGQTPPEQLVIQENGVKYVATLNEGWMTGIFLDQREVREFIREELAAGKHVLNTFSYTGAFSVAAALGGAETTSVDVANRSRELTTEQFAANGIDISDHQTTPDASHHVYVMDVFDYLSYAQRNNKKFDVIVLDPPSFARTKKRTFKATTDYSELVSLAISVLDTNGYIVCSTNAANFDATDFQEAISMGADAENIEIELVKSFRLPEDFPVPDDSPESDYLKVFIYQSSN